MIPTVTQGSSCTGKQRVAVIGGGLAGLAASHQLLRFGFEVHLLEATSGLGGRARVEGMHHFDGFDFPLEHGMHGLWRRYVHMRALIEELGCSGHLVDVQAQSLVFPDDQGQAVHFEIGNRMRGCWLPSSLAFLSLVPLACWPKVRPGSLYAVLRDGITMFGSQKKSELHRLDRIRASDFTNRWPPRLRELADAISHTSFFTEPERVSAAAYFTDLLAYFIRDKRDSLFSVFRRDIETDFLRPLIDSLKGRGLQIHLRRPLASLELDASGRVSAVGDASASTLPVDGVVLALDPQGFRHIRDALPALGSIEPPPASKSRVCRLWYHQALSDSRPAVGVISGFEASAFFWLDRLQETAARWAKQCGGSLLELHFYGNRSEAFGDDERLIHLAHQNALSLWPTLPQPGSAAVVNNPQTHTQFRLGTYSKTPTIETAIPNLVLAGDWPRAPRPVMFMERAATTGSLAAQWLNHRLRGGPEPRMIPDYPVAPSLRLLDRLFGTSGQ